MSNVAIASRFNQAANTFDFSLLESTVAEDAIFDLSRSRGPYRGVFHGYDEIRAIFESLIDAWERVHFERVSAEEIGDMVLEEIRGQLVGRGSGVEISIRGYRVYEFRDGKVVRFVIFQDMDEAREYVQAQP